MAERTPFEQLLNDITNFVPYVQATIGNPISVGTTPGGKRLLVDVGRGDNAVRMLESILRQAKELKNA